MDNSYAPPIEPHKPSDKVLWGKGIGSSPPTVRYEEVMASDEGVLKWLTKIVSTEAPRLFPLFSTLQVPLTRLFALPHLCSTSTAFPS